MNYFVLSVLGTNVNVESSYVDVLTHSTPHLHHTLTLTLQHFVRTTQISYKTMLSNSSTQQTQLLLIKTNIEHE